VPETANTDDTPRFLYEVLGRGGIGFSPFGMDYTGYVNYPLGAPKVDGEALEDFAHNNRLIGPELRQLAALSAQGRVWGTAEPTGAHEQTLSLGPWAAQVSYGRPQFGMDPPKGNPRPLGGVVIAELANNTYLVIGRDARINFFPTDKSQHNWLYARVEEGHFENGAWVFERVWNGDQIDYGLNLTETTGVLRVRLATY
jgi:beta-galactosidase GanA